MAEKQLITTLTSRLPLHLLKSETIPPAPTRPESGSEPVADFIYNFSTHSWIAYAASPLVVISHFPNPLSDAETKVGPIHRQVIELDLNTVVSSVNAVAWSPVTPSVGELAVAWNDCVDLFSCDECSFCWRQTTKLQQSTKVEAIKWTGSGDGIISGGVEVVMWRRQDTSWEIAWKFKPVMPQALVSTTWSAEGFSATAPYGKFLDAGPLNDARNCVLVCQGEDDSQYPQTELRHPVSVTMIQWRPLRPSNGHSSHARRPVLLTCCVDGSVRLWSEIDDGRIRRTGRDNTDQKSTKLSFCVVAVVEVNQSLNGLLGSNVFVSWATEIEGVTVIGKEAHYYSRLDDDNDTTGRCEWLVGFGPRRTVTLWAVHCLDDTAPVRFPRITLWKKQELVDSEFEASQLLLNKILIMRNRVFGPPLVCSLVQLLDCNYFSWTLLHSGASTNEEAPAIESAFLTYAEGILKVGGHTGKVLQIAIHPFSMDFQIAASLDANGMLLFWSYLAFSDCHVDAPTSAPSWKLCGESALSQSPSYTCMSWAPVALGKDRILFMGHTGGVDCFIITIPKIDVEKISFHYLFSTPFKTESREPGLTRIDLILLHSTCDENIISTKFLLVALRMDEFQALSWELTFNYDLRTSKSAFFSSKYSYSVNPCSSIFPSPHDGDKVTSCAVVCATDLGNVDEKDSCSYAYHLMTGCSNGSLKLWRSMPGAVDWGLVGLLTYKQSPIMTVSCSACCRKIATSSTINHSRYSATLCIWECMQVHDAGGFVLEHELSFDVEIVAINWLALGNGQLLLGVCLRNELRVYAQSRCGSRNILKQGNPFEGNAWVCIAVNSVLPSINDFSWGPKGTVVAVHDGYFSLFSRSLPIADEDDMKSSVNIESWQHKGKLANKVCFCSMAEVAENIGGSVYLFHPESLLSSIYSGNWKRAFVALRHLVKHLHYRNNSEKGNCANMHRNIISPVPLSNYLEGIFSHSSGEKSSQWSSSQVETGFSQCTPFGGYNAPDTALSSTSSRTEFTDFIEAVERLYGFTCITGVEKMQTLALIDLLQEISNPHSVSVYGSLDEPGRMFWVTARFQQLFFAQRLCRSPLAEDLVVSSEMIGWAFHSDCLDNLFSSLLSSSEPSWAEMRGIGAGFWYTDATQLRAKMERLARQQYMKNRDPKACTLLYIALNRIQVLAGLFKISKDERDKPLAGFLSRNFQEDKNKGAALKNAYVLMGKHQLELAIAFFLLGGDASSAVNVCVKNLGDAQLALVICRLVEGYNGSLERSLISKILLPSALEKGDFWMASLFEWILGNYSRSYFRMLGFKLDSEFDISLLTSLHDSFMDPSIGQYCLMLASKTSMKNAIGEHNAAVLCGWAALMSVTSFGRSGLPLEALECLASSVNIFGRPTQGSDIDGSPCNPLAEMLKSSVNSSSSNWISGTISCYFMSHSKLSLTMQYISKLLKEHPSYIETNNSSYGAPINQMVDSQEFEKSLKEFREDLTSTITYLEQKFSLFPLHILRMIVLSLHHCGMEFIGHLFMEEYMSEFQPQDKSNKSVNQSDLLLKAAEEFSCIFVKYIATSCQDWSHLTSFRNMIAGEGRYSWLAVWGVSCVGITRSFQYIRAMFRLFLRSHSNDHMKLLFNSLGLFEYLVLFASSCLQRNEKALAAALRPILAMLTEKDINFDFKLEDLNKLLIEIVDMLARSSSCTEPGTDNKFTKQQKERNGGASLTVLEDKRWPIISSSLWVHMCMFLDHQLDTLPSVDLDDSEQMLQVGLLREFVKLACADVSYNCSKHFASYLLQEVNVKIASNLLQLEDSMSLGNCEVVESVNSLEEPSILFDFEQLFHICADPKIILGAFSHEYHNWQPFFKQKSSSGWIDAYIGITSEFDGEETSYKEDKLDSPSHAGGSPLACLSPDDHPFKSSSDKDLSEYNKVMPFDSPKEVHKRNGELLEALCLNSTDECQAGLASNKKGIIFFNWEDGVAHGDKSEYIWGKADWPHNGWAGSKSDPVPTCVSPGVGLGRKMGSHLGLGGATIGDLARPSRHIRGSGSFDVSSNADMEASGLGWGVQENFDEFIDPPATVDNVKTSAFASHPSRPFFLVGSSNTHIYLWKFGKDTATATYGVLPAANVAPPYALASVSSVRFDHCGQRFVTGALDGTVCTWQIEVGGRNNVHPTESSSCFNNHTSDVTYVTASGSIVAAAGHSSSGVNVVVWDTLAPPSTSQASIMCHEGGARSLAVFDNDIGSGSISPLILTGGKNGDVGLHDFRYIATGRTKKQKQSDSGEHQHNMTTSSSSSVDMRSKTGDQNRNGMLWYIPKAHSGSVTKISTIPNTSFFLTGSKDGDVKLWDAKRATLVYHWPRLHDRHTFLQPSIRGFGGVVRAGVTDIQVVSHGFLSCGGDGSVKFVRFKNFSGTN